MNKICALLLLSLSFSVSGCFFIAGAAAGAAAIAIVYDHRKFEKIIDDQHLSNSIADRIRSVPNLHTHSHIDVSCFNGIVLLTGETPNPAWREQAENIAKSIPGVVRIYNQITVEGPTSSLTRTSDAWITTKIKTQMLATEGLKSSSIKVVTENGVVYLMGIVTREQGNVAAELARQITGVLKVVKIFQYKD